MECKIDSLREQIRIGKHTVLIESENEWDGEVAGHEDMRGLLFGELGIVLVEMKGV